MTSGLTTKRFGVKTSFVVQVNLMNKLNGDVTMKVSDQGAINKAQEETASKKALEEFLANGGVIEQIPYGQKSEWVPATGGFYGSRRPKSEETDDE